MNKIEYYRGTKFGDPRVFMINFFEREPYEHILMAFVSNPHGVFKWGRENAKITAVIIRSLLLRKGARMGKGYKIYHI